MEKLWFFSSHLSHKGYLSLPLLAPVSHTEASPKVEKSCLFEVTQVFSAVHLAVKWGGMEMIKLFTHFWFTKGESLYVCLCVGGGGGVLYVQMQVCDRERAREREGGAILWSRLVITSGNQNFQTTQLKASAACLAITSISMAQKEKKIWGGGVISYPFLITGIQQCLIGFPFSLLHFFSNSEANTTGCIAVILICFWFSLISE